MTKQLLKPDYIFESSWEVCNKVGGIYTVLSTRAKTLQAAFPDRIFFIGPDVWRGKENPLFAEDENTLQSWRKNAEDEGLKVRVGRWNIPGHPISILVDFTPFYDRKNEIYTQAWIDYHVDSLHAYGDYDEASMFSYAAGRVVESFYRYNLSVQDKVIYQAHEWMTGLGALYIQKKVPEIATIFTTHATSIGRSIAGNNKPLYDYLFAYNGDQMAEELNMQSKHSIEKQTAHHVDCFTTVSEITNNECRELLDKPADVVLMNGFEDDFVPKGSSFNEKRKHARKVMLRMANKLLGTQLGDDTLIIGTSGRYEFKKRMNDDQTYTTPLKVPFITHWLHNMTHDQVLDMLKYLNMSNAADTKVKVIFVPCYLDGKDGILNESYYDLLIGMDLSVYPSYYEPWGYTPLESVAFHVPTVTTDLAGFGLWVNSVVKHEGALPDGVKVIHRTDYNYSEVADSIKDTVSDFSALSVQEIDKIREHAASIAEKALWKHFIQYYYEAYDIALRNAEKRMKQQ